jgi:hypothetical protein
MLGLARCGADLNGCAPERRLPQSINWNTAPGLESGCATCSPMATLLSAGCPYAYTGTQRTGWSQAAPLARLWSPALSQCFASSGKMRGTRAAHWLHPRPLPGRITSGNIGGARQLSTPRTTVRPVTSGLPLSLTGLVSQDTQTPWPGRHTGRTRPPQTHWPGMQDTCRASDNCPAGHFRSLGGGRPARLNGPGPPRHI